ncbi:MAG: hypothetical protein WC750_04130 [Patescibacteria group bacterium]|jgi:hypothetical protein
MNWMKSAFWAVAIFVVTMVFNLNPAHADGWARKSLGDKSSVIPPTECPNVKLPDMARDLCKDAATKAACPTECAQVACIQNCLQPPATPAATPTPPPVKKPLTTLPSQLICEGGTQITDAKGMPDCGCSPDKVNLENGTPKEQPRVSVLKATRYVTTATTIQFIRHMVCASDGEVTKILNDRLNLHTKKIDALEKFAREQNIFDQAVLDQFEALRRHAEQTRSLLLVMAKTVEELNKKISEFDGALETMNATYKKLRSDVENIKRFVPRFDLAYSIGVMFRGSDAGAGMTHHLVVGYTQTFDNSPINVWAQARAGYLTCNGCDPRTAGSTTMYTGGGAAGLGIGLGDNRAFSIRAGLFAQLVAAPDSLKENGMGRQIGGELQVRYDIPNFPVFIAGVGDLALYNKSNYFGKAGEPPNNIHAGADRSMGGALMFMIGLSPELPFIGSF